MAPLLRCRVCSTRSFRSTVANDIVSGAAGNGDRLLGQGSPTPAGGNQNTRLIRNPLSCRQP